MEWEDPWEIEWEGPGEVEWEGPGEVEWEGPGEVEWEGPGEVEWEGSGEVEWEGPGEVEWEGPGVISVSRDGGGDDRGEGEAVGKQERDIGTSSILFKPPSVSQFMAQPTRVKSNLWPSPLE